MYFVVAGAVRGGRDIERLTGAYLLGAAIYAAVVLVRFDTGEGSDWRFGRLYYYDANDFATFAVTAMPFGLYFAHRGRTLFSRLSAIAALAVLSAAFVRSGSRGGFLALGAMGGFILLRYTAISFRARLAVLVLVGAVLLGTASDKYWQQMGTIVSDTDYNQTAETGRLQIWQRGVGYMLQNPIFGVGANNFSTAEGTLSPLAERQQFGIGVRWSAPHNSFLQVGAELGVPGLILFVGFIASAFVALRRSELGTGGALSSSQTPPGLTQALTASLIGFLVGAFFLSLAYSEILYTLIALGVAVRTMNGVEKPGRRQSLAGARRS
jgi:O-antigen ligase